MDSILNPAARRKGFFPRAAACLLALQTGVWADDVVFKAGVNLVLLDVSVTDDKGHPIPDLTQDQFQVFDNHIPRPLTRFSSNPSDISIAVVVDASRSMRPRQDAVLRGVKALTGHLQKDDQAALLVFNEKVEVVRDFGIDIPPAKWAGDLAGKLPDGQTALYDAVIHASRLLDSSAHDRRVIVVVSDGRDTASSATLSDALNELRSSNRLLYAVGLFSRGDPDSSSNVLLKLAETTGGQVLFDVDGTHLSDSFTSILNDLRSRYLLGFNAQVDSRKGEVRHLSVTVKNPPAGRVHILARREYRVSPN